MIYFQFLATSIKSDPRLAFLNDLIPEPVSVQSALEAQRARVNSNPSPSAPHSPSSDLQDKSASVELSASTSDAGKSRSTSSTIADFFAKRSAASTDIDIEDQ